MFNAYFKNGVFNTAGENNIQVVHKNAMTVTIKAGKLNINGCFGEIDTDIDVEIEQGGSTARTDRIVLRLNDNEEARSISNVTLKGNPNALSLTREGAIYDICIAEINVPASATSLTNANIVDTRLDTDLCGIVAGNITEIDTTTLYNQIQSDLENFQNNEQQEFLDWFDTIKGKLGDDPATALQGQIDTINTNISAIDSNIDEIETDVDDLEASNTDIQSRFGKVCKTITDWNTAVENGFYMASGATNGPVSGQWFFGYVIAHNTEYVRQEVYQFTQSASAPSVTHYVREKMNGTWGSWANLTVRKEVPADALLTKSSIVNLIYPVGSIYISTSATNPGNIFGGTWQAYGQGRTLIGAGTGNDGSTSMSFTARSTGGEYKHLLTTSEMPSHTHNLVHNLNLHLISGGSALNGAVSGGSGKDIYADATGGSTKHNNIQPYIVVYFWRRTA